MPNQRSTGQKLIALWLNADFMRALDVARIRVGQDRSTFIRAAIAEELKRKGISYDEKHVFAPDRAGKGGRKPVPKFYLNEVSPTYGKKGKS